MGDTCQICTELIDDPAYNAVRGTFAAKPGIYGPYHDDCFQSAVVAARIDRDHARLLALTEDTP